MRAILLSALVPVCLMFGCGGEETENQEGDPGTAPVLSDLMINGEPMGVVGEMLTLSGSMLVEDREGDIANLLLEVVLPNGMTQDLPAEHVGAPAGGTEVSVQVLMALRPPVAGTYRVNVRMDDDKGNISEPLSFEVPVE